MRVTTNVGRVITATTILLLAGCDAGSSSDTPDALSTATTTQGEASISPDHVRAGARLQTEMNGANEAPGPGDADGTGTARLTFNIGLQRVCYEISVSDIDTPMASHVHVAPVGEPGPVVIGLPVGDPEPDNYRGCVEDVERALLMAIVRNPSAYYVNVHTAAFPAGAVRGQLGRR